MSGKIVSVVSQMMADGRGINEIAAVVEEMSAQRKADGFSNEHKNLDGTWKTPEQIWDEQQAKKEQDPQTTDASVESQSVDTELASETTSSDSQEPKVKPSQTHTPGDGWDYKYELNEEGYPVYFTKKTGSENWIDVDANVNEEGNITNPAFISVGQEFGHYDKESFDKDAYFEALDQKAAQKEREEERVERLKNPQTVEDMNLTPSSANTYIHDDNRITYMDGKWYKQPLDPNNIDFTLNYKPDDIANFPGQEMPQEWVDKLNSVRSAGEKSYNGEDVTEEDAIKYILPDITSSEFTQKSLDIKKERGLFREDNAWTANLDDDEVFRVRNLSFDDPIDHRNPKTWVNKSEDLVRGMIESNFENVEVEETGVGMMVNIIAPDGSSHRIDLYPKDTPEATIHAEQDQLAKLQRFQDAYDQSVASGKIKYSLNSVFGERKGSRTDFMTHKGLKSANQILKNSGLEYNVVKDGILGYVINTPDGPVKVKDANEVTTWFYNNISLEDKDKIDEFSLGERKKLIEHKKAKKEEKYNALNPEDIRESYFKDGNALENVIFDLTNIPDYSKMNPKSIAAIKHHLSTIITVEEGEDLLTAGGRRAEAKAKGVWQENRYNALKTDLKDKIPQEDYDLLLKYIDTNAPFTPEFFNI